MDENEQSSVEELETPVPSVEETESPEVEETEGENPDEQSEEPEFVEVERGGKKYAIPKELEGELLRQEDYTRKTQEVAQTRQQIELERQQAQQTIAMQRENLQAYVQLQNIDQQLEQFRQVDWNALSNEDPVKAQQAFFRYTQLRDSRAGVANAISQREQQQAQEQSQAYAQHLARGREVLAKEIPNFDKVAPELAKYGQEIGYSQHEIGTVADPRAVKLLWKAMQYDRLQAKASKPASTPAPVAEVVRAKVAPKPPSRMSTDEWMAQRNKEINSRRFKR